MRIQCVWRGYVVRKHFGCDLDCISLFSPHVWLASAHELTSNYLGVGDFLRRESSKHPGAVTMDANSFSCSILLGKSSRFGEDMSPGGHFGLIMQLAPFRSVGEALQSASRSYCCKRYNSERL